MLRAVGAGLCPAPTAVLERCAKRTNNPRHSGWNDGGCVNAESLSMEEEEVGAEGDGEEDEGGDGEDHKACGQEIGRASCRERV